MMGTTIWNGSIDARIEGVKTGCTLKKGDVINIVATGMTNYCADKSHGPWDADGFSGKPTDEQGVMANVLALLIRINEQTFVAGKNLSNWTVPETGELIFLVNDRKNQFKDNSGELMVTVTQAENSGPVDAGDTDPRIIPGLPQNTQLTVTLINNEQWIRTATLNIDGKDQTLEVTGNKAVSKAFTSGNGAVLFSLIDSQKGAMRIPLNLSVIPLGASGNSMTFGSEKPTGETVPRYMDVFVHIDWETKITN